MMNGLGVVALNNWISSRTYVSPKTAFANILATTDTRKQSAVTFKVFVLWLRNQCYYTCDAIGIKMTYRDLPYYEGIRAKTCHEYKLHKIKHKNHANSLENSP